MDPTRPGHLCAVQSRPEIDPVVALAAGAAIAADGKSINNVLCFPGLFDAALRARARGFTDAMLVAAASALAAAAPAGQLLPDPLEPSIHERVSRAVPGGGRPHRSGAGEGMQHRARNTMIWH